jgi:hypothetical protein
VSLGQRTGTYQCWPPEPGSEDSEDAWDDERAHDQGGEQQADADGRAQLTDRAQIACEHRKMVKANTRPADVTTPPVLPRARMRPVCNRA